MTDITPIRPSLDQLVERLNIILRELDPSMEAIIKTSRDSDGEQRPHIIYHGYPIGTIVPLELRVLAYRAFWLLHGGGFDEYGRKRRCFACWQTRLLRHECEHEPEWV